MHVPHPGQGVKGEDRDAILAILAIFVASKVERLSKRLIPQILQLMFVPTVTLVVSVPLTYLAVGPLMTLVSDLLAAGVNLLWNAAPVLCGGILGIKYYTYTGAGLFEIPGMINPAGVDVSFYGFIICAIIAMVVSAICSYIVTDPAETIQG